MPYRRLVIAARLLDIATSLSISSARLETFITCFFAAGVFGAPDHYGRAYSTYGGSADEVYGAR